MEANPMLLRRDVSSSSRVVLVVMILLVVVNLSHCVISSDTSLMSVESQSNTSTSTNRNRNKMDKESLVGYAEEELEYQMDSEITRRILAGTNTYATFISNNPGSTACGGKRSIGKSCVGPVNNQNTNCGKDIYYRAC